MTDILLENVNEAIIKIKCDESIMYELRDAFTFMVPGYQFTPQFRSRRWDGKIRLIDSRTNTTYRGLSSHIKEFCESRDYSFRYDNIKNNLANDEYDKFIRQLNPKHIPREYQAESFIHSINEKRALILSPTGSGKSMLIYMITKYILNENNRGLIIVPTVSLVEQLYSDFVDYSEKNGWNVEDFVGKVYQGQEKDNLKPVTISTWQSLYTLRPGFFHQFDFVIGDEAHQFRSKSLTHIMTNLINAEYRIGTTGTLDGSKTNKLVLEGLFGPVKKVISTKELMEQKHLSDILVKSILLKYPEVVCKSTRKFTYQDEIKFLIENPERNKFIANLALSTERNTLVLFQMVEKHGDILHKLIKSKAGDRNVYYIHGKVSATDREKVREIVENEDNAIIVASYGCFSTGVNIKNLHNVIFASPSKSRIRNLQSIGRVLRKTDDKTQATLYDIADDLSIGKRENYTLKHYYERIKIYSEEKFKFKIYKVEVGK